MKMLILSAALVMSACATRPGPTQIETRDVVVTRTERSLTEQQVRALAPPAPLGARPAPLSAALDLAIAKLCEYAGWAAVADAMLQHAAGLSPVQRVEEPVCLGRPSPPPG